MAIWRTVRYLGGGIWGVGWRPDGGLAYGVCMADESNIEDVLPDYGEVSAIIDALDRVTVALDGIAAAIRAHGAPPARPDDFGEWQE